ncbi:MAG: DUF5985 family protein [Bdellovibrionia bacterium]
MGYIANLSQFLSGATMLGAWACGIYFLKFWFKTRDRLFLIFGVAFWIMAVERLILVVTDQGGEYYPFIYSIRLVSFMLILLGIADKNYKGMKSQSTYKN